MTETKKTKQVKKAKAIKISDKELELNTIVAAMQEKKAERIVSLDLEKVVGASFDAFVVCEALSSTQVRAIADGIEEYMYKKNELDPLHKEGYTNAEWIILDYGAIMAHIFQSDVRAHYRIEDLWGDAVILHHEEGK